MSDLNINSIRITKKELNNYSKKMSNLPESEQYPISFPSVYIAEAGRKSGQNTAYVGETNSIIQRTKEHLEAGETDALVKLNNIGSASLHMIGHRKFNKSATLLIEQMLMNYLTGDPKFGSLEDDKNTANNGLLNLRNNEQPNFYMRGMYENKIFPEIWDSLRQEGIVSSMSDVEGSALFANSPFKQLSSEQLDAKQSIEEAVIKVLEKKSTSAKIIKVEGMAGTGKTVLMSALFKDLYDYLHDSNDFNHNNPSIALLTRQEQQLKTYSDLTKKLNMNNTVFNVSSFINKNEKKKIILVDEGHLLWTGNYRRAKSEIWKPDLEALINLADVIIFVFDPNQIVSGKSYLTNSLKERIDSAETFRLKDQWRIEAPAEVKDYIQGIADFSRDSLSANTPKADNRDRGTDDYDLKFINSASELYDIIKEKNATVGLSRVVATFDWKYSPSKNKSESTGYWYVEDNDFKVPWNLQLDMVKSAQKKNIPWQEIPDSIDEVGSIYTVQGTDLNYVGVILGPSIEYDKNNRSLRVNPDFSESADAKNVFETVKQDSNFSDEQIKEYRIDNIKHAVNVLLTRGVHGLYIYAVNEELRNELMKLND
ncbi:DNA/RNA helicase domain-containing protein [Weissella viridescens]|uniref:DNA/RNA helicase domain-containing protein n=2 Tax=Weissella viridescens TaxID=1629 RepID=UPI0022E3BD62|nr:DNA/RNA helicase domain-containing protein [Weissella viridescens]